MRANTHIGRISFVGHVTAAFYLCPISSFPFFLVQTPIPSATGAVVILYWAPTILLGDFIPGNVLYPHLVRYPLRMPILAFLVPVGHLLRYVRVVLLSSEILAMFSSHIGVVIVIAIVPMVVAHSIVTVVSLATASPPCVLCCGQTSPCLLEMVNARVNRMWVGSNDMLPCCCADLCCDAMMFLLSPQTTYFLILL